MRNQLKPTEQQQHGGARVWVCGGAGRKVVLPREENAKWNENASALTVRRHPPTRGDTGFLSLLLGALFFWGTVAVCFGEGPSRPASGGVERGTEKR